MGLKRSFPSFTEICKLFVWALDNFLSLMKPVDTFSKEFFFFNIQYTRKPIPLKYSYPNIFSIRAAEVSTPNIFKNNFPT